MNPNNPSSTSMIQETPENGDSRSGVAMNIEPSFKMEDSVNLQDFSNQQPISDSRGQSKRNPSSNRPPAPQRRVTSRPSRQVYKNVFDEPDYTTTLDGFEALLDALAKHAKSSSRRGGGRKPKEMNLKVTSDAMDAVNAANQLRKKDAIKKPIIPTPGVEPSTGTDRYKDNKPNVQNPMMVREQNAMPNLMDFGQKNPEKRNTLYRFNEDTSMNNEFHNLLKTDNFFNMTQPGRYPQAQPQTQGWPPMKNTPMTTLDQQNPMNSLNMLMANQLLNTNNNRNIFGGGAPAFAMPQAVSEEPFAQEMLSYLASNCLPQMGGILGMNPNFFNMMAMPKDFNSLFSGMVPQMGAANPYGAPMYGLAGLNPAQQMQPQMAQMLAAGGNPAYVNNFRQNQTPTEIGNSWKAPFRKAATHVAIAYLIYYKKGQENESISEEERNKRDPTFNARKLKERKVIEQKLNVITASPGEIIVESGLPSKTMSPQRAGGMEEEIPVVQQPAKTQVFSPFVKKLVDFENGSKRPVEFKEPPTMILIEDSSDKPAEGTMSPVPNIKNEGALIVNEEAGGDVNKVPTKQQVIVERKDLVEESQAKPASTVDMVGNNQVHNDQFYSAQQTPPNNNAAPALVGKSSLTEERAPLPSSQNMVAAANFGVRKSITEEMAEATPIQGGIQGGLPAASIPALPHMVGMQLPPQLLPALPALPVFPMGGNIMVGSQGGIVLPPQPNNTQVNTANNSQKETMVASQVIPPPPPTSQEGRM